MQNRWFFNFAIIAQEKLQKISYFLLLNYTLLIFENICQSHHYQINSNAKKTLLNEFTDLYQNRDKNFGNGRLVRNIFEKTVEKQATRLARLTNVDKNMLMTITREDLF